MRYQRAARPLKVDGPEAARSFFAGCFAKSDPGRERLWVVHVDAQANCIHVSRHDGNSTTVGLPMRAIITDVAMLGSAGLFLAHNHPSGDPYPSSSDCLATRRLAVIAEALDCRVVDHVIFAGPHCTSFREFGLL